MRLRSVAFFIACGPACFAASTDWDAASQAYADGNYELALQYSEAIRRDGADGPAVLYNLAVCNFKLGRYDPSQTDFRLIAERYPEMRGLAEYNLGLIARRQSDVESAVGQFRQGVSFEPE